VVVALTFEKLAQLLVVTLAAYFNLANFASINLVVVHAALTVDSVRTSQLALVLS
jgi:hypothetical protein